MNSNINLRFISSVMKSKPVEVSLENGGHTNIGTWTLHQILLPLPKR